MKQRFLSSSFFLFFRSLITSLNGISLVATMGSPIHLGYAPKPPRRRASQLRGMCGTKAVRIETGVGGAEGKKKEWANVEKRKYYPFASIQLTSLHQKLDLRSADLRNFGR